MSAKTKGDILAERIEQILKEGQAHSLINFISAALADYRKPWTLGCSVNGFTLGEGQEWHRLDWTKDMLPDGWRPLTILEQPKDGDEVLFEDGWRKQSEMQLLWVPKRTDRHQRTRRPLPPVIDPYAELKAAFKAGKTIQMRGPELDSDDWTDM